MAYIKKPIERAYFHVANGGITLSVYERRWYSGSDAKERFDLRMRVELSSHGTEVAFEFPLASPALVRWMSAALGRVGERFADPAHVDAAEGDAAYAYHASRVLVEGGGKPAVERPESIFGKAAAEYKAMAAESVDVPVSIASIAEHVGIEQPPAAGPEGEAFDFRNPATRWSIKDIADILDMHGTGHAVDFQPGGKVHTMLITARGWSRKRADTLAAAILTAWGIKTATPATTEETRP